MTASPSIPGLYFAVVPPVTEVSPLRSDVAGFLGRTRRGQIGQPVRVEGWRDYLREFGGLLKNSSTTYAIRGYFENEGEVAYVVRLCGDGATSASAEWKIGELDSQGQWTPDSPKSFVFARYRIEATSPGEWAKGTRVIISYRLLGVSGSPEVDLEVQAPDEPPEFFSGLALDNLDSEIAARSLLIRLIPDEPARQCNLMGPGPGHLKWDYTLQGGTEGHMPSKQDYLAAIQRLGEEDQVVAATAPSLEIALVAVPGLYEDLSDSDEQQEVLLALIEQAEQLHNRLVLVDVPTDKETVGDAIKGASPAIQWLGALRDQEDDQLMRSAAVYHPRLWVPDPLGGVAHPLRSVPPSGHVAGVISRLDRQRGAHYTPANAPVLQAFDVTQTFTEAEQALLNSEGINLLRCMPGRGMLVWGGRTLGRAAATRFVAHRRLIHRLVRAIRQVAEPLVFETNGPELWLTLVRAITTVLLEAYRAGALKGARPEEAFLVRCDESTTAPEDLENGRVFCEIQVAPAVPMEFILLRIALDDEGKLEVFES